MRGVLIGSDESLKLKLIRYSQYTRQIGQQFLGEKNKKNQNIFFEFWKCFLNFLVPRRR